MTSTSNDMLRDSTDSARHLWMHYARPRPHWYTLDETRQKDLNVTWHEIRSHAKQQGAVFLGRFHIRGQHDFETVDIWRFPSSQHTYDHWQALVNAGYSEYFAFSNSLGLDTGETA